MIKINAIKRSYRIENNVDIFYNNNFSHTKNLNLFKECAGSSYEGIYRLTRVDKFRLIYVFLVIIQDV